METKSKDDLTQRLTILPVRDIPGDTHRSFIIADEDHTLGNALRYVVMKNPDVEFGAYTMPHPSENKINFRIQTHGPPAVDVFRKGLEDLNSACQHVLLTFQAEVNGFRSSNIKSQDSASMDSS